MAEFTVAVVGNPNSGKTTFFNALTGSTQRVGNWPGVTVEKKEGFFTHNNKTIKVVDLP
ncbi:MAG: 50S ribosome-binding GTPase, partial [Deferribacteraceae bacterium]|nr:50S ribosome-binding GTPase [Deferribacteraceae bacterium]